MDIARTILAALFVFMSLGHAGLARAWLAQRGYDLALYDADVGTLDFGPRPWLRQPNVLAIARGARSAVLERLGDGPLHPPG